jgi:hypothetical protein
VKDGFHVLKVFIHGVKVSIPRAKVGIPGVKVRFPSAKVGIRVNSIRFLPAEMCFLLQIIAVCD